MVIYLLRFRDYSTIIGSKRWEFTATYVSLGDVTNHGRHGVLSIQATSKIFFNKGAMFSTRVDLRSSSNLASLSATNFMRGLGDRGAAIGSVLLGAG